MKVVIAPDKFKGSLTAIQAAHAIERGVLRAAPGAECVLCPMADGGEGTIDVFLARGAVREAARVHGPLGGLVDADYAVAGNTAIVEMARASGLGLIAPSEYDPTRADTYGTGELLRAALDGGAKHLIVGIGGSATNDVGIGMLRALGVRFLARDGRELGREILAYEALGSIDVGRLDERIRGARIEVAVDVDNPLYGPNGASYTFAAQKGATPEQIRRLDEVLRHVAQVAAVALGRDLAWTPGAGAAGGLGFAFVAFLGARLEPGVPLIARECDLEERLARASRCLTGEGKIDAQTLHGKTVAGVAALARKHGVPVVAFCGVAEPAAAEELGQRGVRVVTIAPSSMPVADSIEHAEQLLEAAATAATRDESEAPSSSSVARSG